jgi:hypothetical protein
VLPPPSKVEQITVVKGWFSRPLSLIVFTLIVTIIVAAAFHIPGSSNAALNPNRVCKHHRGVPPGGATLSPDDTSKVIAVTCRDGYFKAAK